MKIDRYYVLCVYRRHGKIIDKYYRTSKEEIDSLYNQISVLYGNEKSIYISRYCVHSYEDKNKF